jgi:DNA polymerase-3 subunit delta
MKLSDREIPGFVKKPNPRIRAVLLWGPDEGRAREYARALVAAVAGQPPDPFRYAELSGAQLKDSPAALADEAGQLAFTGGRRVVRVRAGAAEAAAACEILFGAKGDALVIVEAGDIDGRAALRRMFEEADDAAAIACYRDEGRALADVIRETLASFKVRVTPDALGWLEERLGGDRGLTRAELEKLALYVGPGGEAGLADAQAVVGDSAEIGLDDLAHALADADLAAVERAFDKLSSEGGSAIAMLRAGQRQFMRLHLAAGHLAAGRDERVAMGALRPPVFWKDVPRFRTQLARWRLPAIEAALSRLLAGEIEAKSGRVPQELAARDCLLAVARLAMRA